MTRGLRANREPPAPRVGAPGFGLRAPQSRFSPGQSESRAAREDPSRPAVLLAPAEAGCCVWFCLVPGAPRVSPPLPPCLAVSLFRSLRLCAE